MSRSRNNGSAAQVETPQVETPQVETPQVETPQVETVPEVVNFDSLATTEEVVGGSRVYSDETARVPLGDGFAVIQREIRADGSRGPLEAAILKRNPRTKTYNRKAMDLAQLVEWRRAMRAAGIMVLGD